MKNMRVLVRTLRDFKKITFWKYIEIINVTQNEMNSYTRAFIVQVHFLIYKCVTFFWLNERRSRGDDLQDDHIWTRNILIKFGQAADTSRKDE